MRQVEFYLSIGYAGADYTEVVEYDDDTSDAEIDDDYEAWKETYIEGGWQEV